MLKTELPVTPPDAVAAPGDGAPASGGDDPRDRIPVLGLQEFWYPAIRDRRVGAGKPVFLRMLGEDLCLFRGKSGKVAALANACPHRGAMLAHGNCEFRGFVACFYHGFVFDERGECVAALGEGPDSPMPGKIKARVYPTATLKGVVFVWMGKAAPAPLADYVPEEFFEPAKQVLSWSTVWAANWRPCMENSFDSHGRYLHRNSALLLMKRLRPPAFPPAKPTRVGKHRLVPTREIHRRGTIAQDYYPGLGARWPRHNRRWAWAWFFDLARKLFTSVPPYRASAEWETGQHVPAMVRINYQSYMWTRWAVPIDADTTRMFYFHTAERRTATGRAWEVVSYWCFHHWAMNRNFSAQDGPAAIHAYYDRPEYLAPTDVQLVQWRKLLARAQTPASQGGADDAE